MKFTVDKGIPDLTSEEVKEIESRAKEPTPEEMKEKFLGVKEIVVSPQVEEQLKKMGLSPDELIAMLLKTAGTTN